MGLDSPEPEALFNKTPLTEQSLVAARGEWPFVLGFLSSKIIYIVGSQIFLLLKKTCPLAPDIQSVGLMHLLKIPVLESCGFPISLHALMSVWEAVPYYQVRFRLKFGD